MSDDDTIGFVVEEEGRRAGDRVAKHPKEPWAGELLRRLLKNHGAKGWRLVDTQAEGSSPGMYDLDVILENDRRVAVEVKTYTSEERAELDGNLAKRPASSAPCLHHGWEVWLGRPGSIDLTAQFKRFKREELLNRIKDELPSCLARAERELTDDELTHLQYVWKIPTVEEDDTHERFRALGINDLSSGAVRPCVREVAKSLQDLGVSIAIRAPYVADGTISLLRTPDVSPYGPDRVASIIDKILDKKLERKLKRAKHTGADEVHLFIWVPRPALPSELGYWSNLMLPRHDRNDSPLIQVPISVWELLDSFWIATGYPADFAESGGEVLEESSEPAADGVCDSSKLGDVHESLDGYCGPVWQFNQSSVRRGVASAYIWDSEDFHYFVA